MDRSRIVQVTALAFALVFASFVVRGTTRLVLPYEAAVLLSAPLLFAGGALAVAILVVAVLDVIGLYEVT